MKFNAFSTLLAASSIAFASATYTSETADSQQLSPSQIETEIQHIEVIPITREHVNRLPICSNFVQYPTSATNTLLCRNEGTVFLPGCYGKVETYAPCDRVLRVLSGESRHSVVVFQVPASLNILGKKVDTQVDGNFTVGIDSHPTTQPSSSSASANVLSMTALSAASIAAIFLL